ncbi:MAG: lysyl oxidase family protein [Anaerolineae bacterium]
MTTIVSVSRSRVVVLLVLATAALLLAWLRADAAVAAAPVPTDPAVSIWPKFGPADTSLHVEPRGLPALTVVTVGIGKPGLPPESQQEVRADAQGHLSLEVSLPESPLPGEAWEAVVSPPESTGQPSVRSPAFTVTEPEGEVTAYVVRPGETLSEIAGRLGITVSTILAANPAIANPNVIASGQQLYLPGLAQATSEPLLPDLQMLPQSSLYLVYDEASGVRELRFSTEVVNGGAGPLTLIGEYDPGSDQTRVTQLLGTEDSATVERLVGYFVYHPAHAHWHLEDFYAFELWSYRPDGSLSNLVASTGKVTFCLWDAIRMDSPPPGAPPQPRFLECAESLQGISSGWGDVYGPTFPGQALDVTNLPDGRYAIRTAVNPDGYIREVDMTNNVITRYVEIAGQEARIIPGP